MAEDVNELKALINKLKSELASCEARLRSMTGLRESAEIFPFVEERFHQIFRNTTASMALTLPSGRFIEVNPAFCRFLGYQMDELLALSVGEITHPTDRDETERRFQKAAAGEIRGITIDKPYLRKDGTTAWGHVSSTWFYDEAGQAAYSVAMIQDISERKRTEEDLRRSEERFRSIFQNTSSGMVTITPDGSFLEVNPAFCDFLGYTRDELLCLRVTDITHPDDREETQRRLDAAKGGCRQTVNRGKRYLRKDGTAVWGQGTSNWFFDADDNPLYGVAIIQDISERKLAEEALRESEAKFAKAFHAAPTSFSISALSDGRFIEVNEAFEQISGYRRDEVIGRTSLELGIWEAPTARERLSAALLKGEKIRDLEAVFIGKNGKTVVGLLSAELVDLRGEKCIISLLNDVTDRKRMKGEIEILHTDLASRAAELEIANRDLEAFNYSVSHDLRSPLAGITGYCQVIMELCRNGTDDKCLNYVREIHDAAHRMEALITALLNFSHFSHSELFRETVDLTVIAKAITLRLRMIEPDRRVSISIADGIAAHGDAKLLQVVMENLIGNAWKFTSKQEDAQIVFGAIETGGSQAYFIRDNGPGFAGVDAGKIFQPFQRLPGSMGFAGHGIGLATVQRIIQRHGGRVWAEGMPGKGATFFFTLT